MGYVALAGVGSFILATVLLHWLQPELDPLNEAVSYYVHGAYGWLLTAGLLGLGIGSMVLTIGTGRAVDGPGTKTGLWLLAIWSVGVLVGGIFPADPPGNWDKPPSIPGLIHGNAALVAFLALPIAGVVLARSFRTDARWQRSATLLLTLAIAMVLSLGAFAASIVPVLFSPGPPWLLGLTERILIGVCVLWLGIVTLGLVRTDKNRRITT
jgi:hypothetical protein